MSGVFIALSRSGRFSVTVAMRPSTSYSTNSPIAHLHSLVLVGSIAALSDPSPATRGEGIGGGEKGAEDYEYSESGRGCTMRIPGGGLHIDSESARFAVRERSMT